MLFADIVGFASLAERRDPEQVKRLVDAAFALLVADVEAHGGVVDKVLGDAIVALFGAPVAHEDDADRAVRAALAMQSTLRDFREEHPADEVRMRVGVNTGEVLVGTFAGTDYTAMGDVVNTASRLQQLAPPGAVLVGDATRTLCSPSLRFRPYEEVQLRGRDQEVLVWQAVGHDSALLARRWQSDVPFVGRNTELDVLSNLASISVAGRSAIVAVTGEPGIGKSRLVHEVVTTMMTARPDAFLLEGVCAPYGESNVWWPVAGGLLGRLGLDRNSPPDEARDRVVRRLEPFEEFGQGSPEFDHVVEVVMHLLGHPSAIDALGPSAVRDAVFGGLTFALRRRATKSPVVLWIDDLQWAGPLLLDLLESTARHLADLPLLDHHHLPARRGGHHRLAASGRSGTHPAPAAGAAVGVGSRRSRAHRRRASVAGAHGAVDLGACRRQPVVPHRARPAGGRVPRRSRRPRAAGVVASADRRPARPTHPDAAGRARQRRDPRRRGPRRQPEIVRRRARSAVRRHRHRRARRARLDRP